jgi:hypothetical protein
VTALALVAIVATALGACTPINLPKTIPADRWAPYSEGLGVDIVGLAVHPTNLDRLVIQTSAGIYHTMTGGATPWTLATNAPVPATSPWANLVPNAITLDPKDPDRLYTVVHPAGAYRSTDFGMSWANITGSHPDWLRTYVSDTSVKNCGFFVAGIRAHPTLSGTLIAGTIVSQGEGGVLQSTTDGATWERIAFTCDILCPAATVASPPRVAWRLKGGAAADAKPRGGRACTKIGDPRDNDAWPIVIHPTMPSIMLTGGPYAHEAGRSVDGGRTWTPLPPPVAGAEISAIAVNPAAPDHWIISGTRTFRSVDGGASWTYTPTDPGLAEVQYDEHGNVWGHDGASVLHLPHGGTQWERIPFIGEAGITGLVVRGTAGQRVLFAATAGDGLWVKRGVQNWTRVALDGVGTALRVTMVKPTRASDGHLLLPASGRIHIRRQTDTRWQPLTPVGGGAGDFDVAAGVTEVCAAGVDVACWRPGEIFWTALPHGVVAPRGFFSVRYAAVSDDRLFVTAGLADQKNVLLRFSRGAGGFVRDWTLDLPDGPVAYRLTLHPQKPGSLYLALFDRVIRVDGIDGPSPAHVDLGAFAPLPNGWIWITDIQMNPADPEELYVVDPDGQRLFHKKGNAAWQEMTPFSLVVGGTTTTFGIGELAIDWPGGRMMAVSGRGGGLQEQQPDGTWGVSTLKIRDAAGAAWRAVSYDGVHPETESRALLFLPWAPEAALLATYDLGVYVRDVSRRP